MSLLCSLILFKVIFHLHGSFPKTSREFGGKPLCGGDLWGLVWCRGISENTLSRDWTRAQSVTPDCSKLDTHPSPWLHPRNTEGAHRHFNLCGLSLSSCKHPSFQLLQRLDGQGLHKRRKCVLWRWIQADFRICRNEWGLSSLCVSPKISLWRVGLVCGSHHCPGLRQLGRNLLRLFSVWLWIPGFSEGSGGAGLGVREEGEKLRLGGVVGESPHANDETLCFYQGSVVLLE